MHPQFMQRHKYTAVARLPRRRAFSDIMRQYTKAYRVSDDPVWRDVPILQVRRLDTVYISYCSGKWIEECYQHSDYPHGINGDCNDPTDLVVTTLQNKRVESFQVSKYVSPVFTDAFDMDVHITADKRRANHMFIKLLKLKYHKGDHVFVLDSPAGHTVKLLHDASFTSLHVANPCVPADKTLFALAQWHHTTALGFIRDYPKNVPTHYWLDYCCTFDGCATQTLPRLDIEAIFCRGDLPRYDGVLCMTFSLRGYKATALSVQVQMFMRRTAKTHGYKVKMVAPVFFYKRIAFFQFVTVK